MARKTGISKYTISRFFSQKMQIGFQSYLNTLRLNAAQVQLANTDKDITSIIMDCGYQNQQVFNRNFKKRLGITPSQYREKCSCFSLRSVDTQMMITYFEQISPSQNALYLNGEYVCTEPVIIPSVDPHSFTAPSTAP